MTVFQKRKKKTMLESQRAISRISLPWCSNSSTSERGDVGYTAWDLVRFMINEGYLVIDQGHLASLPRHNITCSVTTMVSLNLAQGPEVVAGGEQGEIACVDECGQGGGEQGVGGVHGEGGGEDEGTVLEMV
jgi:hypothetical protein